jgi:hypothetical protein
MSGRDPNNMILRGLPRRDFIPTKKRHLQKDIGECWEEGNIHLSICHVNPCFRKTPPGRRIRFSCLVTIFAFYVAKASNGNVSSLYWNDAGCWFLDTGFKMITILILTSIEYQVSSILPLMAQYLTIISSSLLVPPRPGWVLIQQWR